jgi:hypothetical protein
MYQRIAVLVRGDELIVRNRYIKTGDGGIVGNASRKTELPVTEVISATVSGILARTRAQTPLENVDGLRVDRWETVLLELVLLNLRHDSSR